MDQKITLSELEDRLTEAEQRLATAQRRLLDDPDDREAAEDVKRTRDEVQLAKDLIAAFEARQIEEEGARAAEARAADEQKCREAALAALKSADLVDAVAKRLDQAIKHVAELRKELGDRQSHLVARFGEAIPADLSHAESLRLARVVKDEVYSSFRPTDELIGAEIVKRLGASFPDIDKLEALKPIEHNSFLTWTTSRTASVRRTINELPDRLGVTRKSR